MHCIPILLFILPLALPINNVDTIFRLCNYIALQWQLTGILCGVQITRICPVHRAITIADRDSKQMQTEPERKFKIFARILFGSLLV